MVSILNAVRSFLNPGAPAIQTRAEILGLDQRAAGMTLYPSHQMNKPIWQTGSTQRYVSEGWSKSPVVFACVLAIADSVATAPLIVTVDNGDQVEPAVDHPLQGLLNQPNPSMDGAEFMQVVSVITALSGFCVIEKERNGLGEPVSLWPLRSDWVRPIPRDQSAPAWEYRVPGRREPIVLEPEDVIVHTHAPDPNMGYTGTAPMSVAFRELGIENAMTDFLKAFFDSGAVPQYGIIPRQQITNQEVADAFLDRVRGKFRETNGGPMLLTGVEDIKRIGFNFDELAYPSLRNLSETNICTAFRVPPILIGIQAGLDASTYSNYGQARRAFYEDTIASLWRRLDGALTRGLVHEFDDTGMLNITFDTGDVAALQDDEDARWARATSALSAGGISTHTYQRMVGLDPHGPDVLYRPASSVPIETNEEGLIAMAARWAAESTMLQLGRKTINEMRAEAGEKPVPWGDAWWQSVYNIPTEQSDIPDVPMFTQKPVQAAPAEEKSMRQVRSARAIPYDSDEHRARWEERVASTDKWESQFATALATAMEEQRKEVMKAVSDGTRSVREIAIDDPFDKDKWIKAFKVTMRPIVTNIVREQGELSATELGVSFTFNVNDPNVIRAMDTQLQRFAEEVNDTTWDALRTSLSEGIADGEGIGQLAERVDSVMVDRIKSSKETIARTETTAASTNGTQESWRQSGVVAGKEWIAALDNRTRETHIHAHGQVVGIDESFSVGGATGPGPGMMSSASESVNCRCSIAPVLDVDMEGQ